MPDWRAGLRSGLVGSDEPAKRRRRSAKQLPEVFLGRSGLPLSAARGVQSGSLRIGIGETIMCRKGTLRSRQLTAGVPVIKLAEDFANVPPISAKGFLGRSFPHSALGREQLTEQGVE